MIKGGVPLKVLTINLAGFQFNCFSQRRIVLIHELNKLEPDIVFLQETTHISSSGHDQSRDIAYSIGLSNISFSPYGNEEEYLSERIGGW